MPRKITQIASDDDRLIVLCSDGTMWLLDLVDWKQVKWEKLPVIPSKDDEDNEDDKDEG